MDKKALDDMHLIGEVEEKISSSLDEPARSSSLPVTHSQQQRSQARGDYDQV